MTILLLSLGQYYKFPGALLACHHLPRKAPRCHICWSKKRSCPLPKELGLLQPYLSLSSLGAFPTSGFSDCIYAFSRRREGADGQDLACSPLSFVAVVSFSRAFWSGFQKELSITHTIGMRKRYVSTMLLLILRETSLKSYCQESANNLIICISFIHENISAVSRFSVLQTAAHQFLLSSTTRRTHRLRILNLPSLADKPETSFRKR